MLICIFGGDGALYVELQITRTYTLLALVFIISSFDAAAVCRSNYIEDVNNRGIVRVELGERENASLRWARRIYYPLEYE